MPITYFEIIIIVRAASTILGALGEIIALCSLVLSSCVHCNCVVFCILKCNVAFLMHFIEQYKFFFFFVIKIYR